MPKREIIRGKTGQPLDRVPDSLEDGPNQGYPDALDVAQPVGDVDDEDVDGRLRSIEAALRPLLLAPGEGSGAGGGKRENGEDNGGDPGQPRRAPRVLLLLPQRGLGRVDEVLLLGGGGLSRPLSPSPQELQLCRAP